MIPGDFLPPAPHPRYEALRDLDEIRPGLGEQVGQQIEDAADGQGETKEEEFDPFADDDEPAPKKKAEPKKAKGKKK